MMGFQLEGTRGFLMYCDFQVMCHPFTQKVEHAFKPLPYNIRRQEEWV